MKSSQTLHREVAPFHWRTNASDYRFCIRPVSEMIDYKWSRGIDPLTIGNVPVKTTRRPLSRECTDEVRSINVEVDIRPGTGGTGINISIKEENSEGNGSLFRIENKTPMPIWIGQDNSANIFDAADCVPPSSQIAFGLTHPSQFQHRSRRDESSMQAGRLVVRVSLCPLTSPIGLSLAEKIVIDAAKDDEKIILPPSVIPFLPVATRNLLDHSVIVGTLSNDGPTRVFCLR